MPSDKAAAFFGVAGSRRVNTWHRRGIWPSADTPCIRWVDTKIEPGLLMEVGLCAFSIWDRLLTAAAPHQQ